MDKTVETITIGGGFGYGLFSNMYVSTFSMGYIDD